MPTDNRNNPSIRQDKFDSLNREISPVDVEQIPLVPVLEEPDEYPIILEEKRSLRDEALYLRQLKSDLKSIALLQAEIKQDIQPESSLTDPRDILLQVAKDNSKYIKFPIDSVSDGTFAGSGTLSISDGCIVLIRFARDASHLVKDGKKATPQELIDSSEFCGGAPNSGAIHTSANLDWKLAFSQIKGTFRIPIADFLTLSKKGEVSIGNLGESEILLSGDVAAQYISEIEDLESGDSIQI